MHDRTRHVQLVILDLAGTLVDYGSCAPAAAFRELFRRHDIAVTDAQARGPMGMHKRDHIETLLKLPAIAAAWKRRHGRASDTAAIDRLYQEFIPLQGAVLRDYNAPVPGVIEAVNTWRNAGIRIGVTTGYTTDLTAMVLEGLATAGLTPDVAVCVDDVPRGRPAPWMALTCAMRLDVYPLSTVVKIGDTLVDIDEGRNAGMWSIGVTRTGNLLGLSAAEDAALGCGDRDPRLARARRLLLREGAHYAVEDVGACVALVEDINTRLAAGQRP